MNLFQKVICFAMASAVLITGCKKDDSENEGVATLNVRMTDAPGNFDAVYIDIQGVEVTNSNSSLTSLNVNPGIYNLLDFTNGLDTLIATGAVASGKIQQIRLILGNNNSVVIDSVTYPLSTPSAQQSGLKLQVHKDLLPGVSYMLLLDFDAHQSIVEHGNGTYSLKPVIRVVDQAITGAIEGTIVPPSIICSVTADDGANLHSTYSDSTGSFLLMGVPAGTYTVTVTPDPPLTAVVVSNVAVTNGAVTNVGLINF